MTQHNGTWLNQKKNLIMRNVFRDFCKSRILFNNIKGKVKDKQISFSHMEKLVGTGINKGLLWHLKDICHTLWQDCNPQDHPEEFMLDWIIGAIFHEAMKLKEDIYLLMHYKPAFEKAALSEQALKIYERCRELFETAESNINHSCHKLSCLFEKAGNQIEQVLTKEKHNPLLIRFLIQQNDLIDKAWDEPGYSQTLLKKIFPEGVERAYCIAGEGFLEGSWYAEARAAFEKALELNPNCIEATHGLRLLEKRINEVTHILKREYDAALAKNVGNSKNKSHLDDSKPDIQEIVEGNSEVIIN